MREKIINFFSDIYKEMQKVTWQKQDEVERFVGKGEEVGEVERVDVPFRVGDSVKVIDGPFADFSGIVQEVNSGKMKLKVMINIFGRKTPVELDFAQVEIEK